ncbi:MAG: hypothetical protein ACE5I1_31670 [bacterium]
MRFDARYTASLGIATTRDFYDESVRILTRYNYLIEKSEEYGSTFYLETRWSVGPPFVDEAEIGIEQSRSRVILRAKAREVTSRSNVASRLNQVVFTAESEVMFEGTGKWQKIPMSDMRKEYFKLVADELKIEFNSGMRVF